MCVCGGGKLTPLPMVEFVGDVLDIVGRVGRVGFVDLRLHPVSVCV